jgi:LemA protein
MVIAIVIAVVVILLVVIYISIRNGMIGSRNRVDEAWSGIDVQLKRRHDLVPNLVETVKGYAQHEQQVFTNVTQARADAMSAKDVGDTSQKEGMLSAALGDLRAVAENYPTLRATENFQQLTRELTEIEDEIQASRRIYNSNVQSYNTKIQVFPNSIIANQGGFTAREFFEIENAAEREPVSVSFTGGGGGGAPAAEAPAPEAPAPTSPPEAPAAMPPPAATPPPASDPPPAAGS